MQGRGEQQEAQQAEEEVFAWQSEDPRVDSESMWTARPHLHPPELSHLSWGSTGLPKLLICWEELVLI